MSSANPPKGRGRGRGRQHTQEAGSSSDVIPPPAISITTDDVQRPVTPLATTTRSRGRGRSTVQKAEVEVHDPEWTVSDLSKAQFESKIRPSKPSELGKIGEPITVLVNYFPIAKYPQEGIAYKYDIEIKNRKNESIRDDHRR